MATKSRKLGPAGQVYDNERVAVLQRLEAKGAGQGAWCGSRALIPLKTRLSGTSRVSRRRAARPGSSVETRFSCP